MAAPGATPPTSAGHLLQLLRDGTVSTRREVRELTALSRSTVAQRVDALIAAGYVVEEGTGSSSGGRPPSLLSFDDRTPTVLAADLGATHGRMAVTDAGGRVLAERVVRSRIATGPQAVLSSACDVLEELLAAAGRDPRSVCGVGIGVPGPVDPVTGTVVRPPIMPGWHGFAVQDAVRQRFDAPVVLDNDANLMARGEQHGAHPGARSLVFVKVGTGIGAGMVVGGSVLRGAVGAEGDIGHVRLHGSDVVCACGATGCLAASASGAAMVRDLGLGSTAEVVAAVERGDPAAVEAVRRSGRLLGTVLATAVAVLNPDVLVLGGDLARAGEHLLRGVHEVLLERTQPLATRHLQVTTSALGDRAGVAGAVRAVLEEVFAPEAVDARLESAALRQPGGAGARAS